MNKLNLFKGDILVKSFKSEFVSPRACIALMRWDSDGNEICGNEVYVGTSCKKLESGEGYEIGYEYSHTDWETEL